MSRILLIETATAQLSTAIEEDGKVIAYLESDEPRMQASLTAVFIDRMLRETGLRMKDFDAVAVSMGPGSYTGLRVGVSTAKGLCFGADLPLIGIGTLDILAAQADEVGGRGREATVDDPAISKAKGGYRYVVPMIDARRMEVYCALFTPDGHQLTPTQATVITPESFARERAEAPVLFIGDGAAKCKDILEGGSFCQCYPKASAMAPLARKAWTEKKFEDLAYFEPFYLKDFVATVSRKKLF